MHLLWSRSGYMIPYFLLLDQLTRLLDPLPTRITLAHHKCFLITPHYNTYCLQGDHMTSNCMPD